MRTLLPGRTGLTERRGCTPPRNSRRRAQIWPTLCMWATMPASHACKTPSLKPSRAVSCCEQTRYASKWLLGAPSCRSQKELVHATQPRHPIEFVVRPVCGWKPPTHKMVRPTFKTTLPPPGRPPWSNEWGRRQPATTRSATSGAVGIGPPQDWLLIAGGMEPQRQGREVVHRHMFQENMTILLPQMLATPCKPAGRDDCAHAPMTGKLVRVDFVVH